MPDTSHTPKTWKDVGLDPESPAFEHDKANRLAIIQNANDSRDRMRARLGLDRASWRNPEADPPPPPQRAELLAQISDGTAALHEYAAVLAPLGDLAKAKQFRAGVEAAAMLADLFRQGEALLTH